MRVCLIPAAGASSRMRGDDKLLEHVEGQPCLKVLADRARTAGAEVIVTLPGHTHPRAEVLASSKVTRIGVPDAQLGMSASLKAGLRAVPDGAHGLMILPGDMPAITADDMVYLWERFEELHPPALQATTEDGLKGHPIIFAPRMLARLNTLEGDRGAYNILNALGDRLLKVALKGTRARLDLDTPEDWAAWRASLT